MGGLVIATGRGIEEPINASSGRLMWNGYILKLSSFPSKEWGTEIRGIRRSPESHFIKIAAAVDGSGYVCTGRIDENVSIGEQAIGSWVVKVSTEGDSLWTRYYSFFDSIAAEPRPKDLKATPDGGYVIVGETRPKFPDGQAQRAWIMKLDEHGCLIPGCEQNDTVTTAISLPVENPMQLAIYPNPTSDYLNFQLRMPQAIKAATFRIVDASGKVVREIESNMPRETHIVPVWGWAAGVYFLQYMENGMVGHSERFVVLNR